MKTSASLRGLKKNQNQSIHPSWCFHISESKLVQQKGLETNNNNIIGFAMTLQSCQILKMKELSSKKYLS